MSKTQDSESKEEQIIEKRNLTEKATELTKIFGLIIAELK